MAPASLTLSGERVRTARGLLGKSQGELALATNVSQAMVSQIESGTRVATESFLADMAAATALPRSFFNAIPPELPADTLRFRKLASARRGDTRRMGALLGEAFRVVQALLLDAKYPVPDLPAAAVTPSFDDIEQLAEATREALGIGPEAPVRHVTRACERSGVAVVPLTLPGEEGEEGEQIGHFGASCWPDRMDYALIGYFPGGAGDRQRYTLAHELGHLVLHSRRRFVDDPEGEANRFAGAFLVPRGRAMEAMGDTVITLRSLQYMKAHWGVSIQALIMRGAQLGLIDGTRKTSLFKQLSARGWRKAEPVMVHREEPALVWRLLTARFGKKAVYQQASDPLGLGAMMLRSIAPHPEDAATAPMGHGPRK
jgi:Zn-dependent peptidase ImmA (M78 family)/DNA-binding XRE family transcriptional regulator